MTTIDVPISHDFSSDSLGNVTDFNFTNAVGTTAAATFLETQVTARTLTFNGSAGINQVVINCVTSNGSFTAMTLWDFTNWSLNDRVIANGTTDQDFITGSVTNDILYGAGGDDLLYGGLGANRLFGGAGDDQITSDYDGIADAVYGGSGTDLAVMLLGDSTTNYIIDISNGGSGADIGDGTTLALIERINFYGGSGNDQVTGGSGNDYVFDHDGNNVFNTGGGNDLIVIYPGSGSDLVDGGIGQDKVIIYQTSAIVLNIDISDGGGGRDIGDGTRLTGIEVLRYDGGAANGTARGGTFADTFYGGAGNETFIGGAGADVLYGGDGIDTLSYATSTVGFEVDLGINLANDGDADGDDIFEFENLIGGGGNDTLTGSSVANRLSGGSGNDTIQGNSGGDTLSGGDGNDFLTGGAGVDVMAGGEGIDRFIFLLTSDSPGGKTATDSIRDFRPGTDRIDLTAIDAKIVHGNFLNDAFSFIASGPFHGVAGELRYTRNLTTTLIEADTTGDGKADFQISLSGAFDLVGTDFFL